MNSKDMLNLLQIVVKNNCHPVGVENGVVDRMRDMADTFEKRGLIPSNMYIGNYRDILELGDEGVALIVAYFMETS